jgi:crotonobetainyl-CoA:carnitine CoA-transferase CaiB-like acyl-CoA transferase
VEQVLSHPQILARDMVRQLDHPKIGKMKCLGNPIKLSDTPGFPDEAPPLLGQHTREILATHLGLAPSKIEDLAARGVI